METINGRKKDEIIEEIVQLVVPEPSLQSGYVFNFVEACVNMIQLYSKKNHDYGNSFNSGMDVIGFSYGIGRLYDKMSRLITITKNKDIAVADEKITDTIQDLACYSIMLSAYLSNNVKYNIQNVDFEGE